MSVQLLNRVGADQVLARVARPDPVDRQTRERAREIVEAVRVEGEVGLRRWAEQLGDLEPGVPLTKGPDELAQALARVSPEDQELLQRVAERIERFARAQQASLREVEISVPGGRAGQRIDPVERAGCYAPGGRFSLPSSVLMTAITARVAGVDQVWVASPRPSPIVFAAGCLEVD
jgi:phosphoribosyl-ATP pyrophosphohydrolase/phosphoribosyl-AMP cyclohydrolase/histidinol dehydrogenase